MIIIILMENLFIQFHKLKYLMTYVKYVLMKENKNLLKLNVVIKYVYNVLNNLSNNIDINYVHYVDKIIGIKK